MSKRILLTGASGFVGRAALKHFLDGGNEVRTAGRREVDAERAQNFLIADLSKDADWHPALENTDVVVHLAARVHQLRERSRDPLADFRRVNTEGSLHLAAQAAEAGVRRFVYVSTAKIYGENSAQFSFRETDTPNPQDAYALSKREAELGLREIGERSAMEICVLRPPLVYGPGVGANFLRLMDHVAQCRWLPLGAIRNRRSLLSLKNLVAAMALCLTHPDAAGRTFNVCDDEILSTPELVRRLAEALNVEARLAELPPNLLRIALSAIGRGAEAERLLGDFVIDAAVLKERLGWQPQPMETALHETAHWYRSHRHIG